MTRRYIIKLTCLLDAETDEDVDKIVGIFAQNVARATRLPTEVRWEKVPTKDEIDKMDAKELAKWLRKMPN